jgi:uncharacterized coiled-coil DUF342 family protein
MRIIYMTDSVDYEKDFNIRIEKELARFKKVKTMKDKFREIYNWIEGLIDLADIIKERIEKIEKDIQQIKDEIKDEIKDKLNND